MVAARDLSRLMELGKRKAELEFKKSVLGEDNEQELKAVAGAAAELALKTAGIHILIPFQDKLDALQRELDSFGPSEIREALKIRDGKVYHALKERGLIIKRNFLNRMEIAKLSLVIGRLAQDEKEQVCKALREGAISGPLSVRSIDEGKRAVMARLLRRCSIPATLKGDAIEGAEAEEAEVRVEVSNRSIWIEASLRPKLEENLKRMVQVNSLIQLRNAERQIKSFNEDEESGFSELQRQYLELLKEQDEILRSYNEEEKI